MEKAFFGIMIALAVFASSSPAAPTNAESAIAEASAAGKFLCLIFYDAEDASLVGLTATVKTHVTSSKIKVAIYMAGINDPANREIAEKYQIQGLPFLLVLAPNGAITGGYPKTMSVTADLLAQSLGVSDLMCKIMKPLQERKVTFVALQNQSTKLNKESWQGVSDLVNDPRYKDLVAAVKADPSATGSQDFQKQCRLIGPMTEATVVIVMPPGTIGKIITGKTSKEDILKCLQACSAGSCKPGACSDRRFKQNVVPIDSVLEKVERLQGVTFSWNRNAYPQRFFPEGNEIGLIAQDVEAVIPEVVQTDADGFKSITYEKLTAVLVEAVKDLKRKIDAQDSIIGAQNEKMKALDAKR